MSKEVDADASRSHYRIISKLGAGGMGVVYLTQDTKPDRKVAIKFLRSELSKDADKLIDISRKQGLHPRSTIRTYLPFTKSASGRYELDLDRID